LWLPFNRYVKHIPPILPKNAAYSSEQKSVSNPTAIVSIATGSSLIQN